MSIGREASSGGPDFSSMAERYEVSRRRVSIDTFTCAAIRRRMFQVCSLSQTLCWLWWWTQGFWSWQWFVWLCQDWSSYRHFQTTLKAPMTWNFCFIRFTQHGYFLLLLCFTFLLILKSIACNHSRLYYVWSEVPEEAMHGDVGGWYHSGSLWSIFAIHEFIVLWTT